MTIDELAEITKRAFDHIEEKLATLATKEELAAVRATAEKSLRVSESVLSSVEAIDKRLQEMSDHGPRIRRLEKEVFETRQ